MRRKYVSLLVLGCLPALAGCSGDDEKATQPGARLVIEECRLVEPVTLGVAPGQAITATGRVRVPGLTDKTPGGDADPELLARFGWVPDGSEPSVPGKDGPWTWKAASAAPNWDGVAAGEPDVDQYRATTTAPGAGIFDLAFAFSPDAGKTWVFCDLDGADREGNGYSPEAAGEMVIRSSSDPCVPDPCTVPPPNTCLENAPLVYTGPGTCRQDGGRHAYVCEYPYEVGAACKGEDEKPLRCHQGVCVEPVEVAFCQHLGPASVTFAGQPIEYRGLVKVPGLTDRTPGVDEDPKLVVRFGYGWPDTDPKEGMGWNWVDTVEAPPDWTDEFLDEALRGSDVYRANFTWAPAGAYDTAWRISADGGATWTNCDLDGAGADGGFYDYAQAGHLLVP